MEKNNARNPGEGGQMLIMFVLALGVLMGMMAMAIDVGMIFHERRSQQNAVDAAALAAVAELPDSPSAAIAAAYQWANKNGYSAADATVTVTTPYQGNPYAVEVTIEEEQPFIFALALGLDSVNVHARAVAHRDQGYSYAVYMHEGSADCTKVKHDLSWSGNDIDIAGDIHSNNEIDISASSIDVEGKATYVCDADVNGQEANFSEGVNQSAEEDWPAYADFEYEDFTAQGCTFYFTDAIEIGDKTPQYWLNDDPQSGVLKPGLYCGEKDIKVRGPVPVVGGNVTFATKTKFDTQGHPISGLTPYVDNVLIFAGHDGPVAVEILSVSLEWEGLIIAKHGEIKVSTSLMKTPSGSLMAEWMKLSGAVWDLTAPVDGDGGPARLIE